MVPETPAPETLSPERPAHDTVDVADLQPEAPPAATADVEPEPSTLELELMAGAEHAGTRTTPQTESDRYREVPDLETVLAEAGVEEVRPPDEEEIAPPPPQGVARDNLLIFDPDAENSKY